MDTARPRKTYGRDQTKRVVDTPKSKEQSMIVVVCSAVIKKGDSFLLVKEFKKSAHGKWGIPGGKLEEGESIHQCLRREVQEETGFKVTNKKLIRIVNKPLTHEGNTVVRFIFQCEFDEEPISVSEHEYAFLSLEQLNGLDSQKLIRGQEILPLLHEVASKPRTGQPGLIQTM